jgi:predicted nuclease with TOPRIM domain
VNLYSSSAEYLEEDKGSEATCARLREAVKRMQVKIQEQEGELELERDRVDRTDVRVAKLEDEVAKLRKQVHRRNCRLTEQEHEIGGLHLQTILRKFLTKLLIWR